MIENGKFYFHGNFSDFLGEWGTFVVVSWYFPATFWHNNNTISEGEKDVLSVFFSYHKLIF